MCPVLDRDRQTPSRMHRYQVFGLALDSPERIPGLNVVEYSADAPHTVRIEFGKVPSFIANPEFENESVQANASEYLFSYPGLLRMYAEGSERIVVEREATCDTVRLWTLILGAGISIAGFRRGWVPLHASAVEADGSCVALAGQSGFGKSTLAASLAKAGYPLHAEDLCLIQPGTAGTPMVGAGVKELRLWDDAVKMLGWTEQEPVAIIPDTTKAVYDVPRQSPSYSASSRGDSPLLPLRRVYILGFADESNPTGIDRLHGVAALQALIQMLRVRKELLLSNPRQHTFEQLAAIAQSVEVFRFVRPFDPAQIDAWTERLAAHIQLPAK